MPNIFQIKDDMEYGFQLAIQYAEIAEKSHKSVSDYLKEMFTEMQEYK